MSQRSVKTVPRIVVAVVVPLSPTPPGKQRAPGGVGERGCGGEGEGGLPPVLSPPPRSGLGSKGLSLSLRAR